MAALDRTALHALGSLTLPSRLKRLGERLAQEVATSYREHGFPFESRWFPVFHQLGAGGPSTATELASRIGCTHTAVILSARRERLLGFDVTPEQVARQRGPVGLAIGAKTPPEIAVSMIAELIALRRGASGA